MSQSLYDLSSEFQILEQYIEENPGVDFSDTIEALQLDLEEKVEGCSKYIRNNEAMIDSLDAEIDNLKSKKEALKEKNQRFKDYMARCLNSIGKKKIAAGIFTVSVRHSSTGSLVLDVPEDQIPKEFVTEKIVLQIDKKALKEAVTSGNFADKAHIVPTPDSIIIR